MAYEKRVCVLKQIKKGFSADGSALSGAVYLERLGTELTVTPRILGIAPVREGRYVLVVRAEAKTFCLEMRGSEPVRIADAPSIKSGVSVLLCFVRGEAEPVAFGACGVALNDFRPLLSALSDDGRKRPIPTPMPPVQNPSAPSPNVPLAPGIPLPGGDPPEEEARPFREGATAYDDEAIAAIDYYSGVEADEDEKTAVRREGEREKIAGDRHPQTDADAALPRGTLTYYKEVREQLDAVLKKYPADTRLKGTFPSSEWARSGDSLIGIVYEEGIPRYLCVAVEKNGDPPEEMKGKCSFVPASPFSEEDGFWVVFQDADTGAYVKVYDN